MAKLIPAYLALLCVAGCSRNPSSSAEGEQLPSAKVTAEIDTPADEQQSAPSPLPAVDPKVAAEREAARLARETDGHRRRGYDAQAITSRQEMVQSFETAYGANSWQVRSARLALWREETLASFPPGRQAANEAAEARTRAANELWSAGERDQALAAIVEARRMASDIWGEDTYGIANLLDQEARWRQATGDTAAAEKLFHQALVIREHIFTREHPETISTRSALGRLLLALQQREEAAAQLSACVEDARRVWGEDHADYAGHLNNLALLYLETGDYSRAADLFGQSVTIWNASLGERHPLVGEAKLNLGRTWYAAREYDKAEQPLRAALQNLAKSLDKGHPATRRARVTLALTRMAQKDYQESEALLQSDLDIVTRQFGKSHPETAEDLVRLAILYGNQGRYREALPLAEHGASLHRAAVGADSTLTRNADSIVSLVRNRLARSSGQNPVQSASSASETGEAVRTGFEQPIAR